jgi:hypothetical protein
MYPKTPSDWFSGLTEQRLLRFLSYFLNRIVEKIPLSVPTYLENNL